MWYDKKQDADLTGRDPFGKENKNGKKSNV